MFCSNNEENILLKCKQKIMRFDATSNFCIKQFKKNQTILQVTQKNVQNVHLLSIHTDF